MNKRRSRLVTAAYGIEHLENRLMLSVTAAAVAGLIETPGTQWTFKITTAAGETATYTQTVIGPAVFNGMATTEIDQNFVSGALNKSYVGFSPAGDYVIYGGTSSTTTNFIPGSSDSYAPFSVTLPASLDVGVPQTFQDVDTNTVTTDGTVTTTPETQIFTLLSDPAVSVTVPAGTYDAYPIRDDSPATTDSADGMISASSLTGYYVPGVGAVKYTDDNGNVYELTDFGQRKAHLTFNQAPTQTSIGAAINPAITVAEVDASGVVDSADANTITATLTPVGSATGVLSGGTTRATVGGVATFDNLSIDKPGKYTLTFSDGNSHSLVSGEFQVTNGKLLVQTQPTNASVDSGIALSIQLVNNAGAPVTDAVGLVVLSLNTVTGGANAVLSGTTSVSLVNGVATFTAAAGPKVNVAGGYTFTATLEDSSTGTLAPVDGVATIKTAKFQVGTGASVDSVTTADSKSLSVVYKIASNPTDAPFPIYVYRSSNATYTPNDAAAVPVAILNVTAGDAVEGTHAITVSPFGTAGATYTFSQAAAFRPDPTHRYLIVTADQTGTLSTDDSTTVPQDGFRFWLIGAVTHGYVGSFPAVLNSEIPTDFAGEHQSFVDAFAANLLTDGYDGAIPFHWEYEADRAIPMQPVEQGVKLEQLILLREQLLAVGLNDVVDLNLIGWSRGTIVVNSALTTLNSDPLTPADIKRGFIGETLVDPHPANNDISGASPHIDLRSPASTAADLVVVHGYVAFQRSVHDLQGVGFVIPSNVNAVSDMYQHNTAARCFGSEATLNLWGISPSQITPNSNTSIIDHLVTTAGVGHSGIMLDTERHIIQSNQTLQALNLFPFGSSATPASAVNAPDSVTPAAGLGTDHLVVDPVPTDLLNNQSFGVTVSALDSAGNVDTNFTGTITLGLASLSGGLLTGTATATTTAGVATFSGLTIAQAGTHRITASSSDGSAAGTTPWFTTTADRFVVTTQPAGATTASPFGLIVSAERADGSVDTGFNGVVTLNAATEPNDVARPLGGVFSRTAVAGTVVFYGLTVPDVGDYLVSATAPGVTDGATDGFTVSGSAATRLVVDTAATTFTAGAPFAISVLAEDSAGHVDASFNGPVVLSISAGPGSLGGTTTVNAVDGVASFDGLTLSTAGAGYTLTAAGDSFTTTTALAATAAGAATTLNAVAPTDAVAGSVFTVTVSAVDGFGTVDTSFNGSVTLSASLLGAGNASVGGTLTVTAVAGVATFSGLTINTAGSGYEFTATATGLAPSLPSGPLSVAGGNATQLSPVFSGQPPVPGVPFTVYVQALDAFGNLATSFTGPVTVAAAAGTLGGTLGGTLTSGAVDGIATFADLTLPAGATAATLTASSGSQSGSATLPVVSADQLVVTGPSSLGVSTNSPFGLTVAAVNASGVVDTAFNSTVTVALSAVPGSTALLGGTLTATAVNGVATFSNLTVDTAGAYSLAATSDTAGAAAFIPVTVTSVSGPASDVAVAFTRVKLPAVSIAGRPLNGSFAFTLSSPVVTTGKFTVYLYADASQTLDGRQVLLGTYTLPRLTRANRPRTSVLHLRAFPASLPAGVYRVLVEVIDPASGASLTATTQTVAVQAPVVTLTTSIVAAKPVSIRAGQFLTVTATVSNTGNVDADGPASFVVGLSTDGTTVGSTFSPVKRPLHVKAGARPLRFAVRVRVPVGSTKGTFRPTLSLVQGSETVLAVATTTVTIG